ncbi:sulfite exporter TauE/SafE family protein [Spongiivirga sp. MCCC 1A20706]|uniref:sulfite exporter TauE/SafE family protein n=1 Tax=Spongiivirga sp. MCCC 1A20706 TaxID=3160963 RepID=UPI0039779067
MIERYLPLFIILSLIAEVLGTVGGFGSSVFFVPIANQFLDFQSVLGITALFHLASNISKITLFRKGFDKRLCLTIGIPAVVLVSVGAYLSKFVNTLLLTYVLGVFLVVLSLAFLIFKKLAVIANDKNAILGGSFAGLFAGLLGTGGPIRGITLAAFNLKKEKFIATSAIIDLGIDLSRSVVYTMNGYVHKHDLYLIPILVVISFVGTYVGKLLLAKITQEQFRWVVLVLILIVGLLTIANNLM